MFDYRNFALIVCVRSFDLSPIMQPASLRNHISFEFDFCMANMSDDSDWESCKIARAN